MEVIFHVDSGAGQSLCSNVDAFISLQACAIQVIGVSGTLPVFGVGTAMFTVQDAVGQAAIILVNNCLLTPGGTFNLLSVSQLQESGVNLASFDLTSPLLILRSTIGQFLLPMVLTDGLYSFSAAPLHINDVLYTTLPRYHLTSRGDYTPPTTSSMLASSSTLSSNWECRIFVAPSASRRVLAFPAEPGATFDTDLRRFCDDFIAPASIPPARQTYNANNPIHMSDLSI